MQSSKNSIGGSLNNFLLFEIFVFLIELNIKAFFAKKILVNAIVCVCLRNLEIRLLIILNCKSMQLNYINLMY